MEMDNEEDRELDIGELTLLEQEEAAEARKLHRTNMIKQQRGFKGERAFIAKPAEISFRDFTVGQPHYLVITITNVSNAFNSFNVLPLPEKIRVSTVLFRTTSRWSTTLRARSLRVSAATFASSSSPSLTKISYLSSRFWRRLVVSVSLWSVHFAKPFCAARIPA
jgi:hypothetical protein